MANEQEMEVLVSCMRNGSERTEDSDITISRRKSRGNIRVQANRKCLWLINIKLASKELKIRRAKNMVAETREIGS